MSSYLFLIPSNDREKQAETDSKTEHEAAINTSANINADTNNILSNSSIADVFGSFNNLFKGINDKNPKGLTDKYLKEHTNELPETNNCGLVSRKLNG